MCDNAKSTMYQIRLQWNILFVICSLVKLTKEGVKWSILGRLKFSTGLGEIWNKNMLMAVMTSPDCLKRPETPKPRPG